MRLLLSIALLTSAASPAIAAEWTNSPGSTLGFTGKFQGEAFDGRFKTFTTRLRFDPAKLAGSHLDVRIDLASADTRNEERDEMLRGPEFFNAEKTTSARFTATRFRALGGGRFSADGVLSLNGRNRPVPLSFTWSPGAKPVLVGKAVVKRLDFGIGTGEWSDTALLPDEVTVSTRLLLAPVPAKTAKAP